MERLRRLLRLGAPTPVPVGEWIPTRNEVNEVHHKVYANGLNRWSARHYPGRTFDPSYSVRDIFPTSLKIGPRTFLEGCIDAILLLACRKGDVPVVSYLLTMYVQYFSIDRLIGRGSVRCDCPSFLYYSEEETRFNELRYDKISLLHAAAEGMEVDVIEVLLSAGATINIQSGWSNTPLISALLYAFNEPVRCTRTLACLLDAGANVNYRDDDGRTPLMYAARIEDWTGVVQMLIEAGANPYAMDNEGCTVLHYACMGRCTKNVVKYLLKIAPNLLVLRGKSSLACLAPYLTFFVVDTEMQRINCGVEHSFLQRVNLCNMDVFLDDPNCPHAIRLDIAVLRIVHEVFSCSPHSSDFPRRVDMWKKFIESAIDPIIEESGAVPVSSSRDIVKEKTQSALLEHIRSMDPTSGACIRKLIQQCLLISYSCYNFSSVPMITMLSAYLLCLTKESWFCEHCILSIAQPLSRMLCFQLNSIQYIGLTENSLIKVLRSSRWLIGWADSTKSHAYLNLAINVFSALAGSLERIRFRYLYELHNGLHTCSVIIFRTLTSFDNQKESISLMIKFAKSCSPLLVNESYGYPESLLHIALSNREMLASPLLQTFLHAGGDRWINTPGVNGWRPLHLGVPKEVEVLLINYGAHLGAVDADGSTPVCCNNYYEYNPRPLSCIVARFIVNTGGLMEHELGLLPPHIQAFLSLHDGRATRAEIDGILSQIL